MTTSSIVDLILGLLAQATRYADIRAQALADGRESLNDAELDMMADAADASRERLQVEIDKAKAAGR